MYDEKPVGFSQSVRQRRRWTQGIRDVQGEYTGRLLRKGKLNAVLGLWSDFLYPLCFFLPIITAFLSDISIYTKPAGMAVLIFYITANLLTAVWGLIKDKKISAKTILNTFGFMLYMISWIPVGIFGIFGKGSNSWSHTKHGNENYK